jgi:hypothetical protein
MGIAVGAGNGVRGSTSFQKEETVFLDRDLTFNYNVAYVKSTSSRRDQCPIK